MLADPLTVSYLDGDPGVTTDANASLTLKDLQLGKTVRSAQYSTGGVLPHGVVTMTISHSESRENKGQTTDRAAVRLECRKTLDSGEASIAQATLTVSSPRLGYTADEILVLVRSLLGTLCANDADDNQFANLARVLAGEP
jgi:hypothetical protein